MKRATVVLALASMVFAVALGGCAKKTEEADVKAPEAKAGAEAVAPVQKNLPGMDQTQGMQKPAEKPAGL